VQATELAWAAPQVMAHRLLRMATAGPQPSARDQREFARMGAEKMAAFYESWTAMAFEALRQQQAWWLSAWRMSAWPWSWPPIGSARKRHHALQRIAAHGLAPVHRRTLANAKRLGRRSRVRVVQAP
jgi:hypothetical protein